MRDKTKNRNIQNLPIDVQTSKLLDWLVDRRHCNLKWQSVVKVIREKINAAIQDMPENEEIKELLSGSYIHYFHCLRIVDILKKTEASSKNIFGKYSSQRIRYEENSDSVYLAELASLLSRNVSYEGPALRKQIAKAQQLQQELSRREVECQSSAADLRERYYAACKQYGITGEKVARELQALVKDLPAVLDEVGKDAVKLDEQIKLYTAFTNFVCEWSEPVLPMLTFVHKRGNTTFYEWRTGQVPTVVERAIVEDAPLETVTDDGIDWGDFGTSSDAQGLNHGIQVEEGIDWGISLQSADTDEGGIDWGNGEPAPINIEVVEAGTDCPEGVAKGEDALSILENPQSRSQFIDELMELEVFLRQRLTEMSEEGDVVAMSQFQLAPSVIQGQTSEHVQQMLSEVRSILGRLTTLRMQHLFMILASPRDAQTKLKQADILVLKGAAMAEKRQETLAELSRLEPRVDLLTGCTKELQKLIEADISKRYHNRPVNLMGVNI
uniref:CDK5 regulatory subunit associated protein 3 n=1 Tax=Neogobius melanostomus TaxID=47308 RepID=A0A8C6WQW8_9GOBI